MPIEIHSSPGVLTSCHYVKRNGHSWRSSRNGQILCAQAVDCYELYAPGRAHRGRKLFAHCSIAGRVYPKTAYKWQIMSYIVHQYGATPSERTADRAKAAQQLASALHAWYNQAHMYIPKTPRALLTNSLYTVQYIIYIVPPSRELYGNN